MPGLLVTGEWREDMTAKVPTADAPAELQEGVQVQLSNGLQATVAEVTRDHVVIDANHALAGKDLTFEVELVKLQKVCLTMFICQKQHVETAAYQALVAKAYAAACAAKPTIMQFNTIFGSSSKMHPPVGLQKGKRAHMLHEGLTKRRIP